ncbi:MAG: hypothetical protein Athens101410_318 [Parcubacteria group bacterium Athens1014_10]|nr:MAG: hypothetical protein Athens101410_318 [Parcubacteria group bacterium Athens1014_10]TSD05964.1 MAG: hypothetical protein Athens071412_111 [Parcubacteria group bacterium Athens0714_12]
MQVQFYAKNFNLTQEIKDYIIGKLQKVLKQAGYTANDIRQIQVDLSENFGHTPDELVRLEVNIDLLTGQKVIRAEERAMDVQTAMDMAETSLTKQIKKHKGRDKALYLRGARFFKSLKSIDPLALFRKIKDKEREDE